MTAKTIRKPSTKRAAADAARAAERAAKRAELVELEQTFEFDEDDAGMVRAFNSLTSHYSEGNALLILAQAAAQGRRVRGLQDVGGFGAFAERGRSIIKGQHKSIFIWARGAKDASEGDAAESQPAPGDVAAVRSFYFPVGIFHVDQTEDAAKAKARREAAGAR